MMSGWWGSMYTATLPLRRPPWFTYSATLLKQRSMGTRPSDLPLVPRMADPLDRTPCTCRPTPPPCLLISATLRIASKMPSMLSSSTPSRKQLLSCCVRMPALKSVGEACVKYLAARSA